MEFPSSDLSEKVILYKEEAEGPDCQVLHAGRKPKT